MISFSLKCACGHRFESWFQSSDAFDKLKEGGMIACPSCSGGDVTKELMAPTVQTGRKLRGQSPASTSDVHPALSAPPGSEVANAIERLRRAVEAHTEDVGTKFAAEARRIHDGEAPERAIRGAATAEDAKALLQDGIPVLPLPFRDSKKNN